MYKLTPGGDSVMLGSMFIPFDVSNRHYQEYLAWVALGNTPDPADVPTPEQTARSEERIQAPLTGREFFLASPAAVAFVRLSPAEQAAAIDGYTLAQLKTVIKYLAVAVSADIKREFLNGA